MSPKRSENDWESLQNGTKATVEPPKGSKSDYISKRERKRLCLERETKATTVLVLLLSGMGAKAAGMYRKGSKSDHCCVSTESNRTRNNLPNA